LNKPVRKTPPLAPILDPFVRTSITIRRSKLKLAQAKAKRTNIAISAVCQRGIDAWLKEPEE
jgi:hypothetical protein